MTTKFLIPLTLLVGFIMGYGEAWERYHPIGASRLPNFVCRDGKCVLDIEDTSGGSR